MVGLQRLLQRGLDLAVDDLERWADLIEAWCDGECPETDHTVAEPAPTLESRDVYAYFDNDIEARAPHNAITLAELL